MKNMSFGSPRSPRTPVSPLSGSSPTFHFLSGSRSNGSPPASVSPLFRPEMSPPFPVFEMASASPTSPRSLSPVSPTDFFATTGIVPASQYGFAQEGQYRQSLRDQLEFIGRSGMSFGDAMAQMRRIADAHRPILGEAEAERILREEANEYAVSPSIEHGFAAHAARHTQPASAQAPFQSMEPTVRTPYHTTLISQPPSQGVGLTPAQYATAAMPAPLAQPRTLMTTQPVQGRAPAGGLRFNNQDALVATNASTRSGTPVVPL